MCYCKGAMAAAVLCAPLVAEGSIVNELQPDWRFSATSVYSGWDSFMNADGGFNAADISGSNCGCSLFNFSPGAQLNDQSDIESLDAGLNTMVFGGQFFAERRLRRVVVNMATIDGGVSLDQMLLQIVGPDGGTSVAVPITLEERYLETIDGRVHRSRAYAFDVGDGYLSTGAVAQWRLNFSSGAGTVLDAVSVDLDFSSVPGPGAVALIGLGGLIAARRR